MTLLWMQVGLLYDEESLQGALDIIDDWTVRERAMLRRKVSL
jgi:glutamate--cysteine ligase